MRGRWLCGLALGAAALFFVPDRTAAQETPDFSGAWVTAQPEQGGGGRGRTPATPGSGWGPEFEISQSADTLMVERDFFSRGDLQRPLRFRFALDGSETTNSVLMGRGEQVSTSTAAWQGGRLVVTTTHLVEASPAGGAMRVEVVRTLGLEGDTLVIETVRSGVLGGPPSTTRAEYVRAG